MSTITNANAGVNIFLALTDKGFSTGLDVASSRLAAFAQRCQGLSQQIGIVSQSINVGFAAAVRQFAAFDDQMRMVAGITGSAGSEFENLTQLAQKLGRETSFTAAQVAGGLGRMGFDSGEIKDSIKAVMDLSRATGTDLAQASEIAGNALRVFGLRTSETGTVADLLATVANRSAQTLADVGEALKTAGPHAARAGETLRDTAAAIGVLANMGIRGSMAGNAIGRTLKQIADPQVAAKLAEMGVATTGADGNLRKLKDILDDIARVTSTMKSGEQIAFFEDIFNARGSLAGGTLAANLPAIERMNEALANCGGAAARHGHGHAERLRRRPERAQQRGARLRGLLWGGALARREGRGWRGDCRARQALRRHRHLRRQAHNGRRVGRCHTVGLRRPHDVPRACFPRGDWPRQIPGRAWKNARQGRGSRLGQPVGDQPRPHRCGGRRPVQSHAEGARGTGEPRAIEFGDAQVAARRGP